MKQLSRRMRTTLLGLSFERGRLEGVVVRRLNGRAEVLQTMAVALSLDLLTNDPQLVGREIRKLLDEARIRERTCVVSLPASWVLALQVQLPDLPEADLASFLQLEAERGFPYGPESLVLGESRFTASTGQAFATLVAIPREHVSRLEAALTAAQLTPLNFSLGITALQPSRSEDGEGVLALVTTPPDVSLQITLGGGVAVLRTIEGAFETIGGESQLQTESFLREVRITLGHLSTPLREAVRRIRVFGQGEPAEELYEELQLRASSWNVEVERIRDTASATLPASFAAGTPLSPALSLAARQLFGEAIPFNLLPPKISAWERFNTRYASRKLIWAGVSAGAIAAIVLVAFLMQQFLLWRWESKWESISTRVTELDALQQRIRQYRPWFEPSYRSLAVLRRLTEAFPEDGAVFARSIEIREPSTVICNGTAQDRQSLLVALRKLGSASEVEEIKVERLGGTPLEFTFNFQWKEAGAL